MKDCVFCQIVAGKIPCYKIYEDDQFLAFLDIAPFVYGHTLVIPKKHYRWVWDLPNVGQFFQVTAKIANHYKKVFKTDLVTSIIWGQLVPHAHIQILPGPGFGLDWQRHKLERASAERLLAKISLKKESGK